MSVLFLPRKSNRVHEQDLFKMPSQAFELESGHRLPGFWQVFQKSVYSDGWVWHSQTYVLGYLEFCNLQMLL